MRKSIRLLVFVIAGLSLIASAYGIFSHQGQGQSEFKTIFGQTVTLYGKGLYKHESVSMAAQAIAQDYVTLFLGIPLLLISWYLTEKGLFKGKLLLTGTIGYFLYTYASYSFLAMYNSMFLVYVALMSTSFFAFILLMMSFDLQKVSSRFKEKLPVKFIGGFFLVVSFVFAMMWLGKIAPSLAGSNPPLGLEQYTTLVIQAMDLGFVIPAGVLAGILIMKKTPFGYLLSSILIIKDITLITALTMMVLLQMLAGVKVGMEVLAVIILINIVAIYCMLLIMKNVKEGERV